MVAGGVAYSLGTIFYANKRLVYRRAIWHIHLLLGAGLHYLAIMLGVILNKPLI
ncbi:hly-III family protein [Asticcacaulis biprosthecium C19]|uniref:Hly-III family protein n=1 Tax=Asticcacaulis biprosthecium C19 TaxID=715226 RepID=F4QNY3_9CAUL|nr:hly-III family protein [Asticcacaulis biprosthecium C19]